MKHALSALNNNITVKKEHFVRDQAEEEVAAKEVVAAMRVEVKAEHVGDPKTTTMTMVRQKRWNSHHTVWKKSTRHNTLCG